MNKTCEKCGGFVGDFTWAGDSRYAKVCECAYYEEKYNNGGKGVVSEVEDAQNEYAI